jgi:hypothetical protein
LEPGVIFWHWCHGLIGELLYKDHLNSTAALQKLKTMYTFVILWSILVPSNGNARLTRQRDSQGYLIVIYLMPFWPLIFKFKTSKWGKKHRYQKDFILTHPWHLREQIDIFLTSLWYLSFPKHQESTICCIKTLRYIMASSTCLSSKEFWILFAKLAIAWLQKQEN